MLAEVFIQNEKAAECVEWRFFWDCVILEVVFVLMAKASGKYECFVMEKTTLDSKDQCVCFAQKRRNGRNVFRIFMLC